VELAKKRGCSVLVINDHDRMAIEYGLPPFRNVIKKRVERSSNLFPIQFSLSLSLGRHICALVHFLFAFCFNST